ncbi:MoaD/ThiS family protein [Arthrobacter gandavensis]|uniref:MoaD/ThiS family protein n=1 Tax=Arthrobacter gandavensis TaxID=169960 RepID=UPI001890B513|nr:MoaD/ThiS family protein [Arthrobacter gandavensis]MBF4994532.1 MoaD/ThiS family protein [Arthrobacter gandavensis]
MSGAEVRVLLPDVLAAAAGGTRELRVPGAAGLTVGSLLDGLGIRYPVLERRIRDERGDVRRFVNIYVDGEDIRGLERQHSEVGPGAEVLILQSIAGG